MAVLMDDEYNSKFNLYKNHSFDNKSFLEFLPHIYEFKKAHLKVLVTIGIWSEIIDVDMSSNILWMIQEPSMSSNLCQSRLSCFLQ